MNIKNILYNFIEYIRTFLRGEVPTHELIRRGLKVGKNFHRQGDCKIDSSHCWLISIGDNVTLAPGVHILAHDASTKMYLNFTKIGRVNIGDNVFIGAESILLPNVNIGNNVIIGAGSVVTKSVANNSVVAGNPAKILTHTTTYIQKNNDLMGNRPKYDGKWTIKGNIDNSKKRKMIKDLEDGIGFVI